MADSRGSTLSPDCNGNDEIESVARNYAEIIVIRHGETEWNADHRIQVCFTFVPLFVYNFLII